MSCHWFSLETQRLMVGQLMASYFHSLKVTSGDIIIEVGSLFTGLDRWDPDLNSSDLLKASRV